MAGFTKWYGTEVRKLIRAAGTKGLRDGNNLVRETSQQRVPVRTAELKRSMRHKTEDGQSVIYYTDSKAAVAHEDLTVNYWTWRQAQARAKFLESAAHDRGPEVLAAVADAIRKVL
jgi:hypothetical protein